MKNERKREYIFGKYEHINTQFAQTAALTTLAEDESLKGYQRKRKAQSFETPVEPKKKKSHSPSMENIAWDTQKALDDLRMWPQDQLINWSKFAREHGIPGKNGGQVIKEFAENHGVDVHKLDGRTPKRRVRAHRKKLPGNEISTPANPTTSAIKQEWASMIQSGKLAIGEACAPFKLTQFIVNNGRVESTEVTVFGRKIPLAELHLRLLRRQEQYMRLLTDTQLQALSRPDLLQALTKFDITDHSEASDDDLRQSLAHYQRHRHLLFWHDHATILGSGFLMITTNILYDPAVFFTNKEYKEMTPHLSNINVQAEIEQAEIYMLAMGSSSLEDQVALVPDRMECLQEVSSPVKSTDGVPVWDIAHFFTGDKPSVQFERGTQQGGTYKCGCGCENTMMDDQAHALRIP